MNEPAFKMLPLAQIYRNLYPWSSLSQFVDQLVSTIAYKSHDNSLIALNKPFGVGTYTAIDKNVNKTNQDKLLYQLSGHPRYCLQDALDSISQEFKSPAPYQVLKGIDRYVSGLVLITNDYKKHRQNFERSISTSRINKCPPYGFRAITSGYPLIKSDRIWERVGCELIEIDELGDYKEPIICANPGFSFKKKKANKKMFQVEMVIKKISQQYSTSLVEIYVSNMSWDIVRCYISSKTSFILGDVRFSRRIREVLGKGIQVSAFRSSHRFDDNYEPLSSELRKVLGVSKNATIPLMLDLHELRLKNYCRKEKDRDLIIRSPHMPLHFAATAQILNLF